MDSGWLLIILAIVFVVAFVVSESAKSKKNTGKFNAQLAQINEFQPTMKREAGTHWVAIDELRGKLLISPVGSDSYSLFEAPSILSVEIYEDGQSLLKSGRGKAAGKAVVNTLVMPGLNLLTGGPKAKAYTVEQVKRVELRIVVDGPKPTQDIRLLSRPVRRDSSSYKSVDANARFLHGKITALMQRAAEDKRHELREALSRTSIAEDEKSQPSGPRHISVADELGKLSALRDSGVLTDEEFKAQKTRLLGGP